VARRQCIKTFCRNQSNRTDKILLEIVNTNNPDTENGDLQISVMNCIMFMHKIKAEAGIVDVQFVAKYGAPQ
jgi:hypothetical protein